MISLIISILITFSCIYSFNLKEFIHRKITTIPPTINSISKHNPFKTSARSPRYIITQCITAILTINTAIINPTITLASDESITYLKNNDNNNNIETKNNKDSKIIGKYIIDGEANRIFMKARQCESDGDNIEAQKLYQEVIGVEPTFIYAWANLGNVLTSEGY